MGCSKYQETLAMYRRGTDSCRLISAMTHMRLHNHLDAAQSCRGSARKNTIWRREYVCQAVHAAIFESSSMGKRYNWRWDGNLGRYSDCTAWKEEIVSWVVFQDFCWSFVHFEVTLVILICCRCGRASCRRTLLGSDSPYDAQVIDNMKDNRKTGFIISLS